MALNYGIKQPLRIYEVKEHRNRYLPGGDNRAFKLICPLTQLLPFQIKRENGLFPVLSIQLIDSDTDTPVLELIDDLDSSELAVFDFVSYDYIVHYGQVPHTATIEPGRYYLQITDSIKTWYSEDITFMDFDYENLELCVPTKIVFWDTCDVADIFYRTVEHKQKQYKNILYLDVDIGRPEYSVREEGEEDAFGELTIEYAVSEKKYLLQHVFPQYILDVLNILPLHYAGEIEISTYRGYTEKVTKISIDPKWQGTLAIFALTDVVITTDIFIKTACCDNAEVPVLNCLKNDLEVLAVVEFGTPNYNNFEYTDSLTGLEVPLEHAQRIMLKAGNNYFYKYYNADDGNYVNAGSFSTGTGVTNINQFKAIFPENIYYYNRSDTDRFYPKPIISDITQISGNTYKLTGYTWKDGFVQVWEHFEGAPIKIKTVSGQDFLANGVEFEHISGASTTYIVAIGLNCDLGESVKIVWAEEGPQDPPIPGIGTAQIGDNFIVAEEPGEPPLES